MKTKKQQQQPEKNYLKKILYSLRIIEVLIVIYLHF